MTEEKTWLTSKEAAALLKCTQRHVLNLIRKNNISVERDESGKYFIHKSEFYRVFPHLLKDSQPRNEEKLPRKNSVEFLEEKIRHLQELVDVNKRHNEFLSGQISTFTEEKSKMLDAINGHTRLLEHKKSSSCSQNSKKRFNWWPFSRNQ